MKPCVTRPLSLLRVCLFALAASAACGGAFAQIGSGRIVVNNDEWTLTTQGFGAAPTTGTFVQNVARWFAGDGVPGRFLARSGNFGINSVPVSAAMTAAGHTYVYNAATPLTLPYLLQFTGVFLAGGPVPSSSLLTQYVQAGGCVYLAGGAGGFGGPAGEANAWNPFLNSFGLSFAPTYNGLSGAFAPTSIHPIFAGVSSLYYSNGNNVAVGPVPNPFAQVLEGGKFGIFDSGVPTWQLNRAGASLNANGISGWQFIPAAGAPSSGTLNLASTNLGLPWDAAITTPEPGVPLGGGGFSLVDSQIVNIDAAASSLSFLNGASFTIPFLGPLSFPYVLPPSSSPIRAQMIVVDPSTASGLSLSQLVSIVP